MNTLRSIADRISSYLAPVVACLVAFFRPAVGSINGTLLRDELAKAAQAGLAAGTLIGGASVALLSLAADAPQVFTSSLMAALVAYLLTSAAERIRRLGHGTTVAAVIDPEGAVRTLSGSAESGPRRFLVAPYAEAAIEQHRQAALARALIEVEVPRARSKP